MFLPCSAMPTSSQDDTNSLSFLLLLDLLCWLLIKSCILNTETSCFSIHPSNRKNKLFTVTLWTRKQAITDIASEHGKEKFTVTPYEHRNKAFIVTPADSIEILCWQFPCKQKHSITAIILLLDPLNSMYGLNINRHDNLDKPPR